MALKTPFKIDVLLPDTSLYQVLHHFSHKIFEALVRAGYQCRLLQGNDRYFIPLESPPNCTLAFNGMLKVDDGKPYCDVIRLPHLTCFVDPPFHFMELASSPYIIAACDDLFCKEEAESLNFKHAHFMPHAAEQELSSNLMDDKAYEIVMLSTFIDCEKRKSEWQKMFSSEIRNGMEAAAALALADDSTSFIAAIKQTLGFLLFDAQKQLKVDLSLFKKIYAEVELYIKGRDKLDLLNAIKDRKIHIFGSSIDPLTWKNYFQNKENIIVHPPVSYMEALSIMKQSKVILNSSIKNKYGAHERIFSGALCGGVVVTNENAFLQNTFTDGENILFYQRKGLSAINDKIQMVFQKDKLRKHIAAQGKEVVLAHHTWDKRIAELIPQVISNITEMQG